ncbi:MAG: c-type cytochrome [Bradymonadia bacterium]
MHSLKAPKKRFSVCFAMVTTIAHFAHAQTSEPPTSQPSSQPTAPQEQTPLSPQLVEGKHLYTQYCRPCHSVDGTRIVGSTFKGIFGSEKKHTDGTTAKVDEAYLRIAMIDPRDKITEGYPAAMPSFKDDLTEAQIQSLIAWIKIVR